MGDDLAAVRALLPSVRLDHADRLSSNDRATVDRVRAVAADGAIRSLIVKQFAGAGEGWVRESAALSVLPASLRGPRLVASTDVPPIVVTEDLGPRDTVADALLGDDPDAAADAVVAWARAVAALHVATKDARSAFRSALDERQGDLPVAESRVALDFDDAVRALDRECPSLGVAVPAGALDEVRALAARLNGGGLAALTPADTCPDNNVRTPAGLVLTDFEGAEWRHLAWDVAYLRVPWPTCWCSWRIPEPVSERAGAAYREIAAAAWPAVTEPTFEHDVEAAVVGWALLTTTWFLDNALGSDPPLHPDRPTPTRRAMILHRLDRAAGTDEIPVLGELAARLATELRRRWGDVSLAYARAFR